MCVVLHCTIKYCFIIKHLLFLHIIFKRFSYILTHNRLLRFYQVNFLVIRNQLRYIWTSILQRRCLGIDRVKLDEFSFLLFVMHTKVTTHKIISFYLRFKINKIATMKILNDVLLNKSRRNTGRMDNQTLQKKWYRN